MKRLFSSTLIVLSIVTLFTTANAQVLPQVWQINYGWVGSASGIALSGDTAFCAVYDHGVRALNIANPAAPFEIASNISPYYSSRNLALSDSFVFLNCNNLFQRIPRFGNTDNSIGLAVEGLQRIIPHANGDVVYLCCGRGGLQVARYVNSLSAYRVIWTDTLFYEADNAQIVGNRLYVAAGNDFAIFDITVPYAPALLGLSSVQSGMGYVYGQDVAISGHYAYLASMDFVEVIDFANPDSIRWVANLPLPDAVYQVKVRGNRLYAQYGAFDCPLAIIDITQPDSLHVLGTYYPPTDIWDFEVAGNYAYIADGDYGVRIVNCQNPANPVEVSTYNRCGPICDVMTVGNAAAVNQGCAIHFVDLTTPDNPQSGGIYEAHTYIEKYRFSGNRMYVMDQYTLAIVDVSNILHPTERYWSGSDSIGNYNGCYYDFAVSGNYCYLGENPGFKIVDATNPTAPHIAGVFRDSCDSFRQFATDSNMLYMYQNNNYVTSMNISNPAQPVVTGRAAMGNYVWNSVLGAAHNGYVYFASYTPSCCIYAYDIHNPTSAVLVDSVYCGSSAYDCSPNIQIASNLLYFPCGIGGVRIIDISNPANLRIVGTASTNSSAMGMAPFGNYALVADKVDLMMLNCSSLGVNEYTFGSPKTFQLNPAYPNPFNATTTISYSLPKQENVRLELFDVLGRNAATLVNRTEEAGKYSVRLDASKLSSGVYFYRLNAGKFVETRTINLVK